MPKRQDWEPLRKIELQIKEAKIWMQIGILAMAVGAIDATFGEIQIDSEFSRRYPNPVSQTRATYLQNRTDVLNNRIVVDSLNGILPSEQIKKEFSANITEKAKYDEQLNYKIRLRNPFIDSNLLNPKSRFPFDVLSMVGGTIAAAYGAWSQREGLMKRDWFQNQ